MKGLTSINFFTTSKNRKKHSFWDIQVSLVLTFKLSQVTLLPNPHVYKLSSNYH